MEMKGMSFYDVGPVDGKGKKKKEDKKEERQIRRANRKAERALNPFNQPPKNSKGKFDDGLSGSCEAGNFVACKTEVNKAPKFNPNKGRISNRRKVGSAKQRAREEKRAERKNGKTSDVYGNPRFL